MTENNAAQAAMQDADVIALFNRTLAAHADGRGFNAAVLAFYRDLLSKLRAEGVQAGDERAAFASHVSGRDDLELYQVENVIDANSTRWATWRAAREYYQQARAALASAPVADEPTKPRPSMCRIAGVSEDVLRRAAERHFKPPFDNCSFRMCDLPGQCRGEGKCHHPATQASEAAGQWRDLALKFDAQRMVFRGLLKAAVPLLIGPEDFKQQIEKALASSPAECLKTQADKDGGDCAKGAAAQKQGDSE